MKKCTACKREYDINRWQGLLPAKDNQLITHRYYKNKCLEWRNCICGSTLVREISCDCANQRQDEVDKILKEFNPWAAE